MTRTLDAIRELERLVSTAAPMTGMIVPVR